MYESVGILMSLDKINAFQIIANEVARITSQEQLGAKDIQEAFDSAPHD